MALIQDLNTFRVIVNTLFWGFKLCILIDISDVVRIGLPLSSRYPKYFVSVFETMQKQAVGFSESSMNFC
jgi:hypothetical protein